MKLKLIFLTSVTCIAPATFCAQKYDDQATNELFKAVQAADLQGVKKALAHGANPNKTGFQFPPLYFALTNKKDSSDIIEALIDAGANMYGKERHGLYVISNYVVSDVFPNINTHLKTLFNKGFDKYWKDAAYNGNTLAHISKREYHPGILQFLLEEGFNIDTKNDKGETIFTIPFQDPGVKPEREKRVQEVLTNYQEKMALHKAARTRAKLTEEEQKKFGQFPAGLSKEIADFLVGPLTPGQKEELDRQIEQERGEQKQEASLESLLAKEQRKVEILKEELRKVLKPDAFAAITARLEHV